MSLESALQEHTAVLRELLAVLSNKNPLPTMSATEYVKTLDAADSARPESKATANSADLKVVATKVEDAAKAETKKEEPKSEPKAEALDYGKDVKPLLLKVSASKGRDALVGLLSKFGVQKGDQLPADKLGAVVAEVNELLAA